MKSNHEQEKVDTTLGDLIEALTEAALEFSGDEREVYLLASLALEQILKKSPLQPQGISAAEVLGSAKWARCDASST
jgi:hypothetical protein